MELRKRVQDTLGGTHTIERELGGGGMSRVFVASEHRLARKVVIKILAPELAASMSAERFEREIQLAASLQQANILPVIAAAEVDGLPFYTTPFVEGESVRARLASGPLPYGEAIDILRDVAKALAYAHERGVVHRDIKPDNVLLSGRSAVVADFGIAKAIAASQKSPAGATLTQLGTSIGTPAYMAPEQGAGDPDVDHRADIYAFGCMAFELVVGKPPFDGLPPHKLLAAHMTETPPSVAELRPDCPPPLARLITRCLAKDPAHRPQDAEEILQQLNAAVTPPATSNGGGTFLGAMSLYAAVFVIVALVAKLLVVTQGLPDWVFGGAVLVMMLGLPIMLFTGYTHRVARRIASSAPRTPRGGTASAVPGGPIATLAMRASPHMTWRRTARGGLAAVSLFMVLVSGYLVLRALGIGPAGSLLASGKLTAQDRVVVAAFDADAKDSALAQVLSEAVRTNLAQSRAVNVVSTSNLVAALRRMQRPATTRVDVELAREVAVREGIKAVVTGHLTRVGAGFIITVQLVNAQSGDELAAYRTSATSSGEIIPAVDHLTRELRGKIGESLKSVSEAPALAQVTTGSLDALRAYAAGFRANAVEGNDQKAIPLYEEAIEKDSNFAAAYVQLAYSLQNLGLQAARRDSLMARAYQLRDRLPEAERYAVEGAYWSRKSRPKAIAALEKSVAIDSFDTDALNSLAILYGLTRDYVRAERAYRRAVLLEPDDGIILDNLVGTLLNAGKLEAADSVVHQFHVRQLPFPIAARESQLLYLHDNFDSAEALIRSTRAPGKSLPGVTTLAYLGGFAEMRGRLREAELLWPELEARNAARGVATSPLTRAADLAFQDAWLRNQDARAIARLDEALRTHPLSDTPPGAPWIAVARSYAVAGAADRARSVLAQYDRAMKDSVQRNNLRSQYLQATGLAALAAGHPQEAVRVFRQADVDVDGMPVSCAFCLPAYLGIAFDRANMADSTIANLERYLASQGRIGMDVWMRAPAEKRLGELYEARGDNVRALSHYRTFVDLWQHADPDLQPKVAEVRARILRLERLVRS
ncbi:MAG TPA: protein kinase [Gemmatimonadaceae bacterium]|nr:protein kinase [Gemmatimonadaceae bacterium]